MVSFRHAVVALLLLSSVVVLGACSNDDGSSETSETTGLGVQATAVSIESFAFSPATFQVKVGDTITVTNKDDAPHTLTAKDGSFDTGTLTSGQSKTITFAKAGVFEFFCALHPSMIGTVTVG